MSSEEPADPLSLRHLSLFLDFVLSGVLSIASYSKLYAAINGRHEPIFEFSSSYFTFALICLEIAFAIWIVACQYSIVVRVCTLVLFSSFLLYNVYLYMRGSKSCGCLGEIKVDTNVMVGVDLLLIVTTAMSLGLLIVANRRSTNLAFRK